LLSHHNLHSFPTRRSSDLDCEAVCCERTKMPVRNVREGTRITFLWTNMSRKTLRDSLESVKASPSAVRDPRKTVPGRPPRGRNRSEEHTSELQSRGQIVCR